MYAHHNTDFPDVLPCNRNNCRCGNDNNCMYYNGSQNGHYNYVAVQGTGDKESPFYKCPSVAYDTFNKEGVYDDQVLGGGPGEPHLGAYNDLDPYGGVNDPKGWYGPAPLSYVEKPTCSGFPNNAQMSPEAENRSCDYDAADRYHKYRKFQLVDNTKNAHAKAQAQAEAEMEMAMQEESEAQNNKFHMIDNTNDVRALRAIAAKMVIEAEEAEARRQAEWISLVVLAAIGLVILYLRNTGRISNQVALISGLSILVLFFLQKMM